MHMIFVQDMPDDHECTASLTDDTKSLSVFILKLK